MTGAPSSPAQRAGARQVARIARLMLLEPADVQGLDGVPAADLIVLHDQISESYFAPGRELLGKVAGLAKVLPATVAGKFAERFLPPFHGARSAEMLEPAKARDLCGKVSVRYLADLSLALDPTRARPILQAIPAQRVGEVAAELFRRREYAAVAEFADCVTPDALTATVAAASGRDLLMVVPLLEWTDRVAAVVAGVSTATLDAVLAALVDGGLWEQGEEFAAQLPEAARERLAQRVPALSDARRARLRDAAGAADAADGGRLGPALTALAASA